MPLDHAIGAQPLDSHNRLVLCDRHMGLYGPQSLLLDPPLLLVGCRGGTPVPMSHPLSVSILDSRPFGASILVPPPVEAWCLPADLELATGLTSDH